MSSLNKGLAEYVSPSSQIAPALKKTHETFLGHVLEVVTDSDSDLYNGIESIGLIRINLVPTNYDKPESDAKVYAYPMDRGNYVLPLAGQQVWGTIGLAPDATQRYYYGGVISTEQTAAAVVVPFLGAAPSSLKQDGYPTREIAAKRFDERNGYQRESLIEKTSQEKFREGDKIIEGQFGGVIKFTHTISKPGVWNTSAQITNIKNPTQLPSRDGDPMLIIKAGLRSPGYIFEDDDINVDECNVYLTTSQNVPLKLNCSTRMASYTYIPTIIPELSTTVEEESTSLSKFFGGGFDPNAKISIKLDGSIGYTGEGSTLDKSTLVEGPPVADGTVIFVSGLTDSKSHEDQTNDFKNGFGNKYAVVSYKYNETDKIKDYIKANEAKVVALVLFSAACPIAASVTLSNKKIYCIEPWNGDGTDAGRGAKYYSNVPAENMYISGDIYARGKGTKQGANITTKGIGHFAALKESAKNIAAKL